MIVIKIQNDYSQLLTDQPKVVKKLSELMKYRQRNCYHTRAYQNGTWDGFIHFMNEKGRFLTGLLPEVEFALNKLGLTPYEKVDERLHLSFAYESIGPDFLQQWTPKGTSPITLYDYQVNLVNRAIKHKRGVIKSPTASGKAQPLDSVIYTPDGPKLMRDIIVGDTVSTPDGTTAKVIGVFPQGIKEVYEITFSNGDTVECCKEHLWLVDSIRNDWQDKIKSTEYLISSIHDKSGLPNLRIKPSKPVFFNKRKIKLNPYMLGSLLGDGNLGKNHIKISSKSPQILGAISACLQEDYHLNQDGQSCDWLLVKKVRGKKENKYLNILRQYGLTGKRAWEKFIPDDYKYNTIKVRMALLSGLFDTDGYVNKTGGVSYTTTSKQLYLDIKETIESLGGMCRVTTCRKKYRYKGEIRIGRLAYVISFYLPKIKRFFNVDYKKSKCTIPKRPFKNIIIQSIKKVGEKECQCILVDHPDHLYLTNNFIPTHNTEIMISLLKALPPNTPTLFLVNRKGLVTQNYKRIVKWGFDNVGCFYGDEHSPKLITCATVQSVHHLDKVLHKFRAVIIDEIHMMCNNTGIRTMKKLKGCDIRIAVSATPFKFGEKDKVQMWTVKGYFGPILKVSEDIVKGGKLTTKFLQERGTLSKSLCTFHKITEPQLPYDLYIDAVTNGIANNYHFHKIVSRLALTLKGRTLIIVERLAHGDILNQLIPGSLWVQGKDNQETREHVIEQLTSSKDNTVAIATNKIFDAGVNVFVHNLINAAGGKAEHDIVQRMGRGLRTADDKELLKYYDFLFRINPYLDNHSDERINILTKEGHEIIIKDLIEDF